MKYTPETAEEIAENSNFQPWAEGEYSFDVAEAEDTFSKKSGEEMLKLLVNVYNATGGKRGVYNYIVASQPYKVRQLCEAVGLLYGTGEIKASELIGKSGKLKLRVEPAKDGYDAKNSVAWFIARDGAKETKAEPALSAHQKAKNNAYQPEAVDTSDLVDEIPF